MTVKEPFWRNIYPVLQLIQLVTRRWRSDCPLRVGCGDIGLRFGNVYEIANRFTIDRNNNERCRIAQFSKLHLCKIMDNCSNIVVCNMRGGIVSRQTV